MNFGIVQLMSSNEEDENAIIEKLGADLSLVAKVKIRKIKKLQLDFLVAYLSDNSLNQYEQFITLIDGIFSDVKLSIDIQLRENYSSGAIVIANHIGINKLTKITIEEMKLAISGKMNNRIEPIRIEPLVNNDPFMFLFAPAIASIRKLQSGKNVKIFFICTIFPLPYANLLDACNAIEVARSIGDQYDLLKDKLNHSLAVARSEHKIPFIVIFPEGGTSGKRNGLTPTTLEEFRSGYMALSKDLDLPILPLATIYTKNMDIHSKFFHFSKDSLHCSDHKKEMQGQIDKMKNENE